jgi:hypothetical protein
MFSSCFEVTYSHSPAAAGMPKIAKQLKDKLSQKCFSCVLKLTAYILLTALRAATKPNIAVNP